MIPDPLHAAVVHFPIVFAVLAPITAALGMSAIRRGWPARRAWALVLAVTAALAASSLAAVRTGEAQEDRVEGVVGEAPLHSHEEAAERFLLLAAGLLLLAGAGMLPAAAGSAFRAVATAGAFVVAAAGWQVGHSGGLLVYRHGAAAAYTQPAGAPSPVAGLGDGTERNAGPARRQDDD